MDDTDPGVVQRFPHDQIRVVGCQLCDGRGATAELREGRRYATLCRSCCPDGERGYLPHVEDPHVTVTV
jgi:hypothetical protein